MMIIDHPDKYDVCDNCKKNAKYKVEINSKKILLCGDCAGTLGFMLVDAEEKEG